MRFVAVFLVIIFFPFVVWACSPLPRTAEGDVAVIEKTAAIITAKIVSVKKYDFSASSNIFSEAEMEITEVYKGHLNKGDHIKVFSKNRGTCSRIFKEGEVSDLLLFEENGVYYSGSTTDYLHPETWEKLKQGR